MQMNPPFPPKSLTEFAVPPPCRMETLNKYKKIEELLIFLRAEKKGGEISKLATKTCLPQGIFPQRLNCGTEVHFGTHEERNGKLT